LDRSVSLENPPMAARSGVLPGRWSSPGLKRSSEPKRSSGLRRSPGPSAAIDTDPAIDSGPAMASGPASNTAGIDPGPASDTGAEGSSSTGRGRAAVSGVASDPGFGPAGGQLNGVRIPMPGRAAARRREMEEAVPEVVDVLRATVAAGINPRRALQAAAEGTPSALSDVLGEAIRAAELGAGAGQALAAAARAERLSELELAGEALDLAETTGAPPGPVLAGVATAAADRVRSSQAVLAATAQARLSARVVSAMAPAFFGVLALTSPSDAAFLFREPGGWATLTAATVLELLGICWATRIVRGPAP
jgi:Type II secretion system (T2SS), protein F